MEQSFRDIASSLNVSVWTACNIFKLFEETGNVNPKHREYFGYTVTDRIATMILAIIFENPNLYLQEMTQKIYEYTDKGTLIPNNYESIRCIYMEWLTTLS